MGKPCTVQDGAAYMPVQVITADAVYGAPDPETGDMALLSPAQVAPGTWVAVRSAEGIAHPALFAGLLPGKMSPVWA